MIEMFDIVLFILLSPIIICLQLEDYGGSMYYLDL